MFRAARQKAAAISSHCCTAAITISIEGRRGPALHSDTGVKQGCPLSPMLFGLLVDGLYRSLQATATASGVLLSVNACVPPTGSYGCEVWGLRSLPAGASQIRRDALKSSHVPILRALAVVPTSVSIVMLLQELGQRPLSHLGGSGLCHFGIACMTCRMTTCTDKWQWMTSLMPIRVTSGTGRGLSGTICVK